jgi:drug/metabolite transporter (DMT)-like permease
MHQASTPAASGRATLMVVLAACAFGAISILVTFATDAGAPLLTVLTWRYVLAALVLAPVWVAQGKRMDARGVRAMLFAGLVQAMIATLSLSALQYISAGTLAFLFYTYPAFVAVIARVRHSEPLTPPRLVALALSLAGIFVMVGAPGGASLHPMGVALALTAALLYAWYIPAMGIMQREFSPPVTALYMAAGAAVFVAIAAATRGELTVNLPFTAWWSILTLAVICTAGGFLLWLRGLDVLGPVRTAIVSTVEPFFTALLGAWLLAQHLTKATLFGGVLIAAAVVLLQLRPTQTNAGRPA